MGSEKISAAVLLDGEYLDRYAVRAIENMVNNTNTEITLLIINQGFKSAKYDDDSSKIDWIRSGWDLVKKHWLWTPFILKDSLFPPKYLEEIHIRNVSVFESSDCIYCECIPAEGLGNKLPNEVIDEISEKAGVAIRFGFGIIKGRVLTAPEYGVLSFHHGDIRKYRGRAGGFWAYINDDAEAGVTLQVLEEELDGGRIAVYESVTITESDTFSDVKNKLFKKSETMLENALQDIEENKFNPEEPDNLGDLYTSRHATDVLKFVIKDFLRRII